MEEMIPNYLRGLQSFLELAAFRAGFVKGFLLNLDLKTCGQMGAVTAAYTVEKYGTSTHKFTKKQFCKRYKKIFGKTIELY